MGISLERNNLNWMSFYELTLWKAIIFSQYSVVKTNSYKSLFIQCTQETQIMSVQNDLRWFFFFCVKQDTVKLQIIVRSFLNLWMIFLMLSAPGGLSFVLNWIFRSPFIWRGYYIIHKKFVGPGRRASRLLKPSSSPEELENFYWDLRAPTQR